MSDGQAFQIKQLTYMVNWLQERQLRLEKEIDELKGNRTPSKLGRPIKDGVIAQYERAQREYWD